MERALPLLSEEVFDAHLLLFAGELLALQPLDGFLGATALACCSSPLRPHAAGARQACTSTAAASCAAHRCSDTWWPSSPRRSTCSSQARRRQRTALLHPG